MHSFILKRPWAAGLALLLVAPLSGPAWGGQAPERVLLGQPADPTGLANPGAGALQIQRDFVMVFDDPADAALGATLEPVSDALRTQLGIPGDQGLVIVSLAGDGPAAAAGLRQNDILLYIADKPLASTDDLAKELRAAGEAPVRLRLMRGGKPVTVQVRPVYRVTLGPVGEKKTDYYIGVAVAQPDDTLRAHLELPAGVGLVATEVVANTPAEKAGVKVHDILLELDDKPLDSPQTLVAQVQAAGNKATPLKLLRAGKPLTVSITPELRTFETTSPREGFRVWSVRPPFPPHPGFGMSAYPWVGPGGDVRFRQYDNSVDRRLDRLDQELKALRQSVDELRGALEAAKAKGRD
jgi:membrane-associated protease RseP (regulator of RpoE activity)